MRSALAALALAISVLIVPSVAEAHDRNNTRYVTQHEHHHVLNGWHKKSVIHRHFETDGRRIHYNRRDGLMVRQYKAPPASDDIATQVFYVRLANGTWLAYDKERF